MKEALKIISIQHELVLAIGNTLELKTMLQQFFRVCNSRLELNSSHVYLFQENNDILVQEQSIHKMELNHCLSLPRKNNGILWTENHELNEVSQRFLTSNHQTQMFTVKSNVFYCFSLDQVGVLIVESKALLEENILNALLPVFDKLTISCKAATNHQALITEIQTRKTVEEKIRYQASHDQLTGIFNRTAMENTLKHTIYSCEAQNHYGALLLIDLIDFKHINDVMGHNVGDEVLQQVALHLKTLEAKYTVARFGGDEFMILIPELPRDKQQALAIVTSFTTRIVNTIETPIEVESNTFSISCAIGYELFNDSNTCVSDIIKHAGIAMYEAIKIGHVKATCYQAEMLVALNNRLSYIDKIKQALVNNDFELHYQPQFNHLNEIIGAEALLRWNHPTKGYESPAVYIPIAEESELIVDIGDYVLNQACHDIKEIAKCALPVSFEKISINVSAKQLSKANFVDTVMTAIDNSGIAASRLEIEITESIMVGDIEHSIATLEALHQQEVECAIDDFGTGYSSLTYLKRLPASLLKIDRAFVTDIDKDKDNYSIANMIIMLGNSLNMNVIAEGVENQKELDCLIELGCFRFQGFFFSRPLPFIQFQDLLEKQSSP